MRETTVVGPSAPDGTDGAAALGPAAGATGLDIASGAGEGVRRWWVLGVVALAQLMIVLDATVVTVALPSAQHALSISLANRQWVMSAYTLAFGTLLLLGGRIADLVGRRRAFVVGLLGFAIASALGGLAQDQAMLFGARAFQGAFAALMAPAALSILTVTFVEPAERARAFGVYGGIAGGGAAIGLLLGGVLTQFASWRWTLLINAPIAVIAVLAAVRFVPRYGRAGAGPSKTRSRYDLPGVLTSTGGFFLLVLAFSYAGAHGWATRTTVAMLVLGAALLAGFVAVERRAKHPLLPLRVVLDPDRGGAFLSSLLIGVALLGAFLFLTYFLQGTLHYSALRTGFAFLPFSGGIIAGAGVASRLLPRAGPRALMTAGLLMAVAGLAWFTQLTPTSSYVVNLLPAEIVTSLGMGLAFVPMSSTSLVGVEPESAGVASALVNTTQQVGGSLGIALLNTIAASATAGYLGSRPPARGLAAAAAVHGYAVGFEVATGFLGAAAIVAFLLIRSRSSSGARGAAAAELVVAPEPVLATATTARQGRPGPAQPRTGGGCDGPQPRESSRRSNDGRRPAGSGCPGQRSAAGTRRITCATCWPQPAHVVLPHVLHLTERHIPASASSHLQRLGGQHTPLGIGRTRARGPLPSRSPAPPPAASTTGAGGHPGGEDLPGKR